MNEEIDGCEDMMRLYPSRKKRLAALFSERLIKGSVVGPLETWRQKFH